MKKVKKDAICLKLFGYLKVLNILMDPNGTVGHSSTVAFLIEETIADVHVVTVWFGVGGSGMGRKQNFSPFLFVCLFFLPLFLSFFRVMVRGGIKVSIRWEKLSRKSRGS